MARQPVPLPYPRISGFDHRQNEQLYEDFQALARQGQGTRWATIVIAASDSTAASKAKADYICTGSADEAKINAAITELQDRGGSTGMGRIVLLEGSFFLSDSIGSNAFGARHLVIQGMGGHGRSGLTVSATRLVATTTAAVEFAGSSTSDGSVLTLMDLAIINASSGDYVINNVDMTTIMHDCYVVNSSSGGCLRLRTTTGGSGGTRIQGNHFHSTGAGVAVKVGVGPGFDVPAIIADNTVKFSGAGIGIECVNDIGTVPAYLVTGNSVTGSTTGSGVGIQLDGNSIENCVVADNRVVNVGTGIACGGYRHNVSGNVIQTVNVGVATGPDSQYLAIIGNHVASASVGFQLANSAISPTVIGNKGTSLSTAYTVASGVTSAFIGYNDFGGSTGTDSGTGTTIPAGLPPGGLTNYVLKKNSATDFDASWALDPVIDLAAQKGNLLAALGVDSLGVITPERDGQILMLDSPETTGVRWGPKVTISESAPTSPQPGDIWIDPS